MHEQIAKYLANEMNEAEVLNFEGLLRSDEILREELFAQIELLELQQPSTITFDADKAFKTVSAQLSTKVVPIAGRREKTYSLLKIAATLLILITAGFFITREVINSEDGRYGFVTGATISVFQLPDGTEVKLNANSSIEMSKDFGVTNREIFLVGAANFDVATNEELPFTINTTNSSVEVIGTVFEVNAYPEADIELNVAEGKVRFASKTSKNEDLFIAGERGLLTADGKVLTKTKRKNENYAAWWSRRLDFEDAYLDEVFQDLERTYHVEIEYDEALATCQWNTILEDKTLIEVFQSLSLTFSNISKIDRKDSVIILEGTACKD
jgi:transmembrane sensor